jgi:hypothetical protein
MKFLETLVELFNWCLIFISPVLLFGFAGFVIYHNFKGNMGISSFIGLSVFGIVLGIYFAEKIRRSVGCANFMTRRTLWKDS